MEIGSEAIETMGVVTYCLLWLTVILGLGLWKLRIRFIRPKYHYLAAGLTLLAATIHVILVSLAD